MADKTKKSKSLLRTLFPGFGGKTSDLSGLSLPGGGFYEDFIGDAASIGGVFSASTEDGQQIYSLPPGRLAQYPIYDTMASDPTIDSALKMHIAHALSARSDSGEIIKIESVNDEKNAVVEELRGALAEIINRDCHVWAYNAALYGSWFARVYLGEDNGISAVRSDFYTHPRFMTEYRIGGMLAGYTSTWQQASGTIEMMEPWKFVSFKIPIYKTVKTEPYRVGEEPFDISRDDYKSDVITETQNYGQSLIETAFVPWMDLLDAIVSLNMSRKNAAKLERLIGVNTGKLNPQKAAQYLNVVSSQMQKTDAAAAEKSLKKGFIQTVMNHIIPIFGDGRGRLDISTVEGSPNIDGLADVDFHVHRLCSALGVEPALVGFSQELSGGMGDGGFFRVSITAAMKANLLRRAILDGVERLCEIHVASKLGKVFLPGEKPWRIMFNSVSTSLEREERENMEGRVAFATGLVQMAQLMDQEMVLSDKHALANYLWTDILKVPEEKFSTIFPPQTAAEEAAASTEDPVMESAIKTYIDGLYTRGDAT